MIENLNIIFRIIKPETVLRRFLTGNDSAQSQYASLMPTCFTDTNSEDEWIYEHAMRELCNNYTPDEIHMRYLLCHSHLHPDTGDEVMAPFNMLAEFASKMIRGIDSEMRCRVETIDKWNSAGLKLGQDIFTAAYMASLDSTPIDDTCFYSFTWPAILRSDDVELNKILGRGISENHFHLNGSTQNFSISWICCMNHPESIDEFYGERARFRYRLTGEMVFDIDEIRRPLNSWIKIAALIRSMLFDRTCLDREGIDYREKINDCLRSDLSYLISEVHRQRFTCPDRFAQPGSGGNKCLDYAIDSRLYNVDLDSTERLLSGERYFLYRAMKQAFQGNLSKDERTILYLYLLIKSKVRQEIIQANGMKGFKNFARYQDRKEQLFEHITEYKSEALRLSVAAPIREDNVISLEMRIAPSKDGSGIYDKIERIDQSIDFALGENARHDSERKHNHFYVLHFIKQSIWQDSPNDEGLLSEPRNHQNRQELRKQASAIKSYIETYGDKRVHGIDACNFEIGCRPETFATEFRYLKNVRFRPLIYRRDEPSQYDYCWGRTYHAGEDFIDIADGLRAIDEAVLFLGLERGNRIGHALALGTEARAYYESKQNNIVISKQDLLDNIVWLLHRTHDFGIELRAPLKKLLSVKARHLFYEIYGMSIRDSGFTGEFYDEESYYQRYYESWILRGDNPDLHRSSCVTEDMMFSADSYEAYMKMPDTDGYSLESLRQNPLITLLVFLYHRDPVVRRIGMEMTELSITPDYMEFITDTQKAYQKVLARKGIAIECNPTSNVLIGAFDKYELHPLLKFDNNYIVDGSKDPNLFVSINTDDIGVFDTSLANEYAMMLNAIQRRRHEAGNENDMPIYQYLEHLREQGNTMSFCKKKAV